MGTPAFHSTALSLSNYRMQLNNRTLYICLVLVLVLCLARASRLSLNPWLNATSQPTKNEGDVISDVFDNDNDVNITNEVINMTSYVFNNSNGGNISAKSVNSATGNATIHSIIYNNNKTFTFHLINFGIEMGASRYPLNNKSGSNVTSDSSYKSNLMKVSSLLNNHERVENIFSNIVSNNNRINLTSNGLISRKRMEIAKYPSHNDTGVEVSTYPTSRGKPSGLEQIVPFTSLLKLPAEIRDVYIDQSIHTKAMSISECPVMCKCHKTVADCSGHLGKLTYIPALPENITLLMFTHNSLFSIRNQTFFSNVTNITGLDLSSNGLTFIGHGAFRLLRRLTNLTLNNNNITDSSLRQVLSVHSLKILGLIAANLKQSAYEIFYQNPLTGLQHIFLHQNNLKVLNITAFVPFSSLKELGAGGCYISEIILDILPSLQSLNLNNNEMPVFPETCRNGTSLFFNLFYLNLDSNDLIEIPYVCLPNLEALHLSYNRFQTFPTFMFNETRFPKLKQLTLLKSIGTGLYVTIEKYAFSNPTLQVISLGKSTLSFFDDNIVHPDAFAGCSSLREIQLDNNIFTSISDIKFFQLFGSLSALRTLYIGYSYLTAITENTFKCLPYVEEFYLYGNALVSIPDGAFDYMKHLRVLHLGDNKLTIIRETTFHATIRHGFQELDLSSNPFICSCDIMWFQAWFLSNRSMFHQEQLGYYCTNLPNTSLVDFTLPDQACLLSSDAFILTFVSVSLVLITLILTAVFYHLRWHIRLLLYEAFRGGTGERRRHYLLTGHFPYDVFVSYAAEDLDWVRLELMKELEERIGLRLCIHQRDFIPGKNIVDNIVDSLDKSKKVLLVFSTHYARSQWCQFELALCLQHIMEHDDILLIVCLEDLPNRVMTGAMMAVLKVTTYIQWEDDIYARASFWGRLKIALNEIFPT